MANRDRVKRYKTEGAAADLVRVEVLVPPNKRGQIVNLAALLRQEHRASRAKDALEPLRRFRADVEAAFPGRLRDIVLFGSRARGDNLDDSDWDVAVYIDDCDRGRESRWLNLAYPLVSPTHYM